MLTDMCQKNTQACNSLNVLIVSTKAISVKLSVHNTTREVVVKRCSVNLLYTHNHWKSGDIYCITFMDIYSRLNVV